MKRKKSCNDSLTPKRLRQKLNDCNSLINISNLFVGNKYNLPIDVFLIIFSFLQITSKQSETSVLFYLWHVKNCKLVINNKNINNYNRSLSGHEFYSNIVIEMNRKSKACEVRDFVKNRLTTSVRKLTIVGYYTNFHPCNIIFRSMNSSKKQFLLKYICLYINSMNKNVEIELPNRSAVPIFDDLALCTLYKEHHYLGFDMLQGYGYIFRLNESYNSIKTLYSNVDILNHTIPLSLKHVGFGKLIPYITIHHISNKFNGVEEIDLVGLKVIGMIACIGYDKLKSLKSATFWLTEEETREYFTNTRQLTKLINEGKSDEADELCKKNFYLYAARSLLGKIKCKIIPK